MPELPEVETMRRGIAEIAGSTIVRVSRTPCQCKPILIQPAIATINRRVAGQPISQVRRVGKRIVLELVDASALVIEPRMTGLVLISDPPTPDHLRLRIQLASGPHPQLLFWDRRGLGTFRWYSAAQKTVALGPSRIGVDALVADVDQLRQLFSGSQRPIKVALLDQAKLAGVGNLYAAEVLFVAGIDPRLRCDRLTAAQWKRLHAALKLVLLEAIAHEGSTLGDGTYRNALNSPGRYQNHHRVYNRQGSVCPRCQQGIIRRIVQAQRATFFCSVCQRKQGLHHSAIDVATVQK